jgi:hypothetical protein
MQLVYRYATLKIVETQKRDTEKVRDDLKRQIVDLERQIDQQVGLYKRNTIYP